LGAKPVSLRGQPFPELAVVLDDPVVHDGDTPGAVEVRMGVCIGGPAVGRPPRVGDAQPPLRGRLDERLFEARDLSDGLTDLDLRAVQRRDPRGVVPAVLEPAEGGKEHGNRFTASDVSDDSTHDGFDLLPYAAT